MKFRFALIAAAMMATVCIAGAAHAQCAAGLLVNCPPAVNPQGTDVVGVWQLGQNPHMRAAPLNSILGGGGTLPGNFSTLAVTNNATIGGTLGVTGALTLAHNPNTLNVRDYGAVGNGTTDDTAAIQTAATACPAAGCTLYFPPGYTFGVSGTLLLSSNTHILAYGATLLDISGNFSFLKNLHNSATTLTDSNITIEGLTLDYGTSGTGGGYHAIEMSFVNHVQVLSAVCQLRGAGDCTAMIGTNDTLVQGNSSFGSTNAAYDHWWGASNARVIGNYASIQAGYAALMNTDPTSGITTPVSTNLVFSNNEIVCPDTDIVCIVWIGPISLGSANNVVASNNTLTNSGIRAFGVTNVSIVGNTLSQTTVSAAAIHVGDATSNGMVVANNVIIDPPNNGDPAVIVMNGTNGAITGNVITGTRFYAATDTYSAPVVISGNSFSAGLHGYQNIGTAWVSATHPTIMATGQTITPATIAGIVGTTAADNAQVGSVGEYLLGGTGGNFVSSGTPANVGLLSLSPGDWDVTGVIFFQPAATTTVTGMWAGISTTSATLGGLGTSSSLQATFTTGATQFLTTPVVRINVATTTTVYIVGQASYGVSTFAYQAAIRARRVR